MRPGYLVHYTLMLGTDRLSESYNSFFNLVYSKGTKRAREAAMASVGELPAENVLQGLWFGGAFGESFVTTKKEKVRLLDLGEWNRSSGPDFKRARFLLGGKVKVADIELDPKPEDWERHGHGENPEFNNVGLHIVFQDSAQGEWFTRNSDHKEIPVVIVPRALLDSALGKSVRPGPYKGGKCLYPLSHLSEEAIRSLMLSAAAYRWQRKGAAFRRTEDLYGKDQARYEALAETLGYSRNKHNMRLLAQRVPISRLTSDVEAVLFGTAGFLVPFLPESTTPSAQGLHKRLWETWWKRRDEFDLSEDRKIHWDLAGLRPANRPERRLAALSLAVTKWKDLRVLFADPAKNVQAIIETFSSFSHAYWSRHVTLPGEPLHSILALIGKDRVTDFLVNHLLPGDNSDLAWDRYMNLLAPSRSDAIKNMSTRLFGKDKDLKKFLKYSWQHQALLQIYKDFCLDTTCEDCPFPEQLKQWGTSKKV